MSIPPVVWSGFGNITTLVSAKAAAPIVQFLSLDALREAGGEPYKRIHGIIGYVPLYNVRKITSTDASRPLFFRPTGEVFMSAREGGSTQTVRLEMFVTGPYALLYIEMLKLLKRLGAGSLISKIIMNASGVPLPVLQQTGNVFENRISAPKGLQDLTYPFITRSEVFSNARIEYLHIEREVKHGVDFAWIVKLDIVKISDPYIIGSKSRGRAMQAGGALGFSADAATSALWALLNCSGAVRGASSKLIRYAHFSLSEGLLLSATKPDEWQKAAVQPYDFDRDVSDLVIEPEPNIYSLDYVPVEMPIPKTVTGIVDDLREAEYTNVEDPSGRYSGKYTIIFESDANNNPIYLENFPVRKTVASGAFRYHIDIIAYIFTATDQESPRQIGAKRLRLDCGITSISGPSGDSNRVLSKIIINDRTSYKIRDPAAGLAIYLYVDNVSWPVDDEENDVSNVPINMRVRCAIK